MIDRRASSTSVFLADRVEHVHGLELGGGSDGSGEATRPGACYCTCIKKAYVLALRVRGSMHFVIS